jgi:outer membrane protein OmpA-like peptidoglycan-associated protein
LLLGWAVFVHGDAQPDELRRRAEAQADSILAQGGFGWAHLRIDNTVGRLHGEAPDERSRANLTEEANRLLQPLMGVLGVFLRIENQAQLNEQLPKRPPPPPPEPEIDLLANLAPPGAGKSPKRGPSMAACEKAFAAVQSANLIRFKPGSAQIDASTMPRIQQVAALAQRCSQWRVIIEGPTDAQGDRALNEQLSRRRAAAVAAAMILEGVPLEQLESVGRRASRPLTAASGAQPPADDRRIVFHLAALQKR